MSIPMYFGSLNPNLMLSTKISWSFLRKLRETTKISGFWRFFHCNLVIIDKNEKIPLYKVKEDKISYKNDTSYFCDIKINGAGAHGKKSRRADQ